MFMFSISLDSGDIFYFVVVWLIGVCSFFVCFGEMQEYFLYDFSL